MGLGFGIISEIKKAVAESLAPIAETLVAFKADFVAFKADFVAFKADFVAFKDEVSTRFDSLESKVDSNTLALKRLEAKVDFLIAEVSRYKNDSDELMLSVYAFCTLNGVSFSQSDLFTYGGQATRYSRRHGFSIATTQDPRFGIVNLYEPEVLERVILGFTDEDYLDA